jgi:hypothetical protein
MTEDELPVGAARDLKFFRDKLAKAITVKQANRLRQQIKILEDTYQLHGSIHKEQNDK